MANTGWQICRTILRVAASDNSILLDRNGLECDLTNPSGIPISASGLKQAAKVWDQLDTNSLIPSLSFTYQEYYDIVGTYPVVTEGVPTTSFVYSEGAIVARWRGNLEQPCYAGDLVTFEASPSAVILDEDGESLSTIQFLITSLINNIGTDWVITQKPDWITLEKTSTSLLKLTSYEAILEISRIGEILLTQNTSGETLSISLSQESSLRANLITLQKQSHYITLSSEAEVTSTLTVYIHVVYTNDTEGDIFTTILNGSNSGSYDFGTSITSAVITDITPRTDEVYKYFAFIEA